MKFKWNTFFVSSYILLTVYTVLTIIYYGRRPIKSISWVLAVITLPFAGPLRYYLFGINRRKFKLFSSKQTAKRKAFSQDTSAELEKFIVNFEDDLLHQKISSLMAHSGYASVLSLIVNN